MHTIKQVLQTKGNDIWSLAPDTSVFEALQLMAEKEIGALLVLEDGHLAGIFSERDYARKVILKGKSSDKTCIGEAMTKEVITVSPTDTIGHCMALMTSKRIRHLPVLEGGRLVGIVTIGDVIKRIISEQEDTIHELEKYIQGSY